ncbi:hypothetical protein T08_16439 [Trichinella sp. T8]|nr:hypothetical protein T08_16439 [Trichinella sp. T8]
MVLKSGNELVQRSGQFLRTLIVELMAYCAHASGGFLDFAWLSPRFRQTVSTALEWMTSFLNRSTINGSTKSEF